MRDSPGAVFIDKGPNVNGFEKRTAVLLTREHDGEKMGLLPFTCDLCSMISKQRDESPKLDAITPLEVAVSLGSGDRVYVNTDRLYSYRVVQD